MSWGVIVFSYIAWRYLVYLYRYNINILLNKLKYPGKRTRVHHHPVMLLAMILGEPI